MRFMICFILFLSLGLRASGFDDDLDYCIYCMFINDNPKLIVDWSPKSGCTSVWKMLFDGYGLLDEVFAYSSWIHDYREHVYSPSHRASRKKFLSSRYYKVKFVRNPYQRAVSSYLYICQKTSFRGSFEDFLERLINNSWTEFDAQEVAMITAHARKQSKYSDKFMNEIIRIENPNLKKTNKKTGLNFALSKYFSEHHVLYDKNCDRYCGNEPFVLMQYYPVYHCYYSDKTLVMVEKLYHEDIQSFGYKRPSEVVEFLKKRKQS